MSSGHGKQDSPRAGSDDVGDHKRVFVCLNGIIAPADRLRLKAAGIFVHRICKFGRMSTPLNVLTAIKVMIRQGRAVWLHGTINRAHWHRPTWLNQCCRLAHRAGTPWSVQFGACPWTVKPYELLRRHKYVRTATMAGRGGVWMASDLVDLASAKVENMVNQALQRKAGVHSPQCSWVDRLANSCGEPTKRQQKAMEDQAAIGGLRRPHLSISKWPTAKEHGNWLRGMVDGLRGIDSSTVADALKTLGQATVPQCISELALELRRGLCNALLLAPRANEGLQGELIHGLAVHLRDPDVPVRGWLRDDAVPLGIDKTIEPAGIFPTVDPRLAGCEQDLLCGDGNYSSYDQHKAGADAILQSELDQGWLEWASTERELGSRLGPVTYSRIGVVAKEKQGLLKLRLIHDLRRSGVNDKVVFQERVVLPRLDDAIADALELVQEVGHERWEGVVLDFSDAFKQLVVAEEERRHLGGRALGGVICYHRVPFGIRSGPLVWGRTAALLMRMTAILNHDQLVRIECFVDDPLLLFGGERPQRDRLFLRTVLLWLALGFKIAWRKGDRGRKLDWIGAVLRAWLSPTGVPGVTVSITAERIRKLKEECCTLLGDVDQVPKSRVRQLAGLATWIAGVMPQMSAFTSMLWAAINSGPSDTVSVGQLRRALVWISTLCGDSFKAVERRCRPRAAYFSLTTDRSRAAARLYRSA